MKPFFYNIPLLALGFLFTVSLMAQNDPLAGRDSLVLENERIEDIVEREKPNMKPPSEQFKKPNTDEINYTSKEYYIETDFEPQPPEARPVENAEVRPINNGMIKLGIGRFVSPLAQIFYNNKRDKDLDYGLEFTHRSVHNDNITLRRDSEDLLKLTGSYINNNNKFDGSLGIYTTSYYNYGDTLPRASDQEREDALFMRFGQMDLKAGVMSLEKENSSLFYDADVVIRYHRDHRTNSEAHFGLLPKIGYQLTEDVSINLGTGYTYTWARINSGIQNRSIVTLAPTIAFGNEILNIEAGIKWDRYNANVDTSATSNLAPNINIRYALIPGEFIIVAGYTGAVQTNHYMDLIRVNPYIATDVSIQPSVEKLHLFGGIQGNFGGQFDYSAKAYFKRIENALVYTVPIDGAYFQPSYDESMTVFGVSAEANYDFQENLRLGASFNYNVYDTKTLARNFHATPLRLDAYGEYTWFERLTTRAEMTFYGTTPVAIDTNNEIFRRNSFLGLSFSGDYRIIDRFSVFLSVDNLLSGQFQRWHNYPERPINISGGLTFVF